MIIEIQSSYPYFRFRPSVRSLDLLCPHTELRSKKYKDIVQLFERREALRFGFRRPAGPAFFCVVDIPTWEKISTVKNFSKSRYTAVLESNFASGRRAQQAAPLQAEIIFENEYNWYQPYILLGSPKMLLLRKSSSRRRLGMCLGGLFLL